MVGHHPTLPCRKSAGSLDNLVQRHGGAGRPCTLALAVRAQLDNHVDDVNAVAWWPFTQRLSARALATTPYAAAAAASASGGAGSGEAAAVKRTLVSAGNSGELFVWHVYTDLATTDGGEGHGSGAPGGGSDDGSGGAANDGGATVAGGEATGESAGDATGDATGDVTGEDAPRPGAHRFVLAASLEGHRNAVLALALGPCGRKLATAGQEGEILIFGQVGACALRLGGGLRASCSGALALFHFIFEMFPNSVENANPSTPALPALSAAPKRRRRAG